MQGQLPPISSLSEKEQMQLAEFYIARRPLESPLNRVQRNLLLGDPLPKEEPAVREVSRLFIERYHMCLGQHKKYQW